jgi:hypothetical protein
MITKVEKLVNKKACLSKGIIEGDASDEPDPVK